MYIQTTLPQVKSSNPRAFFNRRIRLVSYVLVGLYLSLMGRLAYIQLVRRPYYERQANQLRLRHMVLVAQRGDILDINGVPLAMSVPVGDIIADPTEISNPQATAQTIAQYVSGINIPDLTGRIQATVGKKSPGGNPLRYLVLTKDVPYSEVKSLEFEMHAEKLTYEKNSSVGAPVPALNGISIVPRTIRSYPNGDLAAQVLGFLSKDTKGHLFGQYGVEQSYNSQLSGHDGLLTAEVDGSQRIIPWTKHVVTNVQQGGDVTLTIDSRIQSIAQMALMKTIQEHHAQSGSVVVLDPRNGNILALANLPIYDPNNLVGSKYGQWDDRAVSDLYEPGSTMKTLTLSAVLDTQGLQMMYQHVYCNGEMQIGNHTIHCAKDPPTYGIHGDETMRDVLRNSCNIGAAKYAIGLGAENLYKYEKSFGLLENPNSGLPGEEHSRLGDPDVKKWSEIQLANVAFGQGISASPLQVASIYATIANNGMRVYPHIIKNAPTPPSYQVVKPEVAQAMLSMLHTVVTDGTGKPAQIADYLVGGKTGSAQVAEHGHYGDQYIGSFCGIAPLTNPSLVVLCVVTKPQGVHWGAVVAAPVVHDILKQTLWYQNVPPDAPGQLDYTQEPTKPAAPPTRTAQNSLQQNVPIRAHRRHHMRHNDLNA